MPERQGADLVRALGVASAVAIPISLVALAFLALVEQVTTGCGATSRPRPVSLADSWWWVLLIPTVGGVLAGLAVRHLPGGGGHDPINGFSAKPVAPDAIPGVVLAALASLAFGAVVGPEAPLVALGSALGLWGARLFRQSGNVAALAASAGLFAAISALFGNPLLAAFLVLEAVGATALAAPLTVVVLPGLLAAGLGYVVFTGVGEWAGVAPTSLAIDGLASYPALRLADVLWAAVIGVAMALVGFAVRFIAARTHAFAAPRPAVAAPIGGLSRRWPGSGVRPVR
jgi:H+/Cl- antiporter ClcA